MDQRQFRYFQARLDHIESMLMINTYLLAQQRHGEKAPAQTWEWIKNKVKNMIPWLKLHEISEHIPEEDPGSE